MKSPPTPMDSEDRALLSTVEPILPLPGSLERGRVRLNAEMDRRRPARWMRPSLALALVAAATFWLRSPSVERLLEGDTRVVDAEPSILDIGDRARVWIHGPGQLHVPRLTPRGAAQLQLEGEYAQFRVVHVPDTPFDVHLGDWVISVLGTRFSVRTDGEALELELSEGTVRVRGPGVDSIYRAPARARLEPRVARPGSNGRPAGPGASAQATERGPQPIEPVDLSERPEVQKAKPIAHARPPSKRNQPASKVEARGAIPSLAPPPERHPALTTETPVGGTLDSRSTASESVMPEASRMAWLNRIEALVRQGAFSEARLQLQAFLAELAPSARTDMAGLRIAVGLEDERALFALSEGLAGRAHDPRLDAEIKYWQGELARRRGDCGAAEGRFEQVMESKSARAEDALWSLGWCLTQREAFEPATKVIKLYLGRYPEGRYVLRARAWLKENGD